MKQIMRKLTAWLCAVVLLAVMLPTSVFAADAISASKFVRGGVLTLTEDTQVSVFGVSLKGKGKYTLDLNGYTLSGSAAPYFSIGNGATLVIRDSVGDGEIRGIEADICMFDVQSGGKLVLESGSITGHTSATEGGAIYNAGTFEMTGGTISGNTARLGGAVFAEAGSTTSVSGGIITDNTATYRGGGISTAETNLGGVEQYPEVTISGGTITGNKTLGNGATLYLHTSRVNISGGTVGSGLAWDESGNDWVAATGSKDSWLRGSHITLSGGTVEELTIRPESGCDTNLTITGSPVVASIGLTLTAGTGTTTSSIGQLTGGAYIKSSAELTVADGDTTVSASGKYIYEGSASAPVGGVIQSITNIAMQPGADITQRNITWYSQSAEAGCITYAKTADMNGVYFPAGAVRIAADRDEKCLRPGFYNNKVTVKDLTPGTSYTYQLSNGRDTSELYTFEVGEKTDSFNFVFLGDPQLGQSSAPLYDQKAGWDRTLNQLTTDPIFADADFWVCAGDQVTAGADYETQANMYDALLNNQWMPTVAMSTLVGNHDNGSKGDHYQHFNPPGYIVNPATGKYYGYTVTAGDTNVVGADYWFTYNSILFICLNVNDFGWGSTTAEHGQYYQQANEQTAKYHLEFIDKVLELNEDNTDIRWKIVVYHQSPYGSSYHNNYTQDTDGEYSTRPEQYMFIDMRRYLLPGIYQRDFDVILSGHDHVYTRTHVMEHYDRSTNGMYLGNETVSAFANTAEDGKNYYTYADGTTSPTYVGWTDVNGRLHYRSKVASVPVKVTAPEGVLHITAASSSGSSRNADDYVHPMAAVTVSGKAYDRQAVLVEVTDNTLTFTNYALGSITEDYVLTDNVLDTFTIEKEPTQSKTFADTAGHWSQKAVDYVVANGIMSGYNADRFGPDDTLNRAMVVQVLYNKEGQPALNGLTHSFSDVPASQWFNNAVTWGSSKGVVSGFGGGLFKPEDAVTIEQVAVILHNYCGKPAGSGELSRAGSHSDWAADALRWAVGEGILDGVPFTNAAEKATRAQTAQMLMNFCENME